MTNLIEGGPWAARRIGPPSHAIEIFAGGFGSPPFPVARIYESPKPFGTAGGRRRETALAHTVELLPAILNTLEDLAEWRDVLVQDYPDMASLVRAANNARAILGAIKNGEPL